MKTKIISKLLALMFISLVLLSGCNACIKQETFTYQNCTYYKNIQYGEHKRNFLDICFPNETNNKMGLILFIHGGGWKAGDKDGYSNSLIEWTNKGYVSASINYRYASKKYHINDILDDITLSLKKIKDFALEKGVIIEKALLTGGSAGGHLSMQYAYSRISEASIKPSCVVSYSGPTDLIDINYYENTKYADNINDMFTCLVGKKINKDTVNQNYELLINASPINYVSSNTVPTVICHGDSDDLVPLTNAQSIVNKFIEYNVKHDFIIFKNSGHGLENDNEAYTKSVELMEEYAQNYLK